jgi:hypothetical protein
LAAFLPLLIYRAGNNLRCVGWPCEIHWQVATQPSDRNKGWLGCQFAPMQRLLLLCHLSISALSHLQLASTPLDRVGWFYLRGPGAGAMASIDSNAGVYAARLKIRLVSGATL